MGVPGEEAVLMPKRDVPRSKRLEHSEDMA